MQKPADANQDTSIVVETTADPFIGKVIGDRYEVQALVGRGGMGVVYKAMHRILKKPVALKVLPQGQGLDRVDIARFDAEAKAASGLHHPNLAGIHDYGTAADGSPYLVMDFIDGESLADLLERDGALKESEAIDLCLQICNGLEFAHSKRLIHRDIKPSNIMVSKESGKLVARLVDFGIAKKLPTGDEHNPTLTGTGQIVGSPQYMSPEQCLGHTLDIRSDIYSFGLVMFEALTGKKAFEGENSVQVIFQHINERAPLFRAVAPDLKLSSAIERIVLQALEKEADNRYQTVEDLKRDLELVKEGKNPVKEVSRMRNKLRSAKKAGKLLAFACFCVATTLGLWWFCMTYLLQTPWSQLTAQARTDLTHFNYDLAENKYQKALDVAAKAKAPDTEREQIIFEFATLYEGTRRQRKAIELLEQGLAISNSHALDSMRGSLYDEMAKAYLHLRDYKQAEAAARKAVEIKETTLGKMDPLTAHSVSRLGGALSHLHRYEESEAAARRYVDIETKVHPNEDDPEVCDSYKQLTYILADQGTNLKNEDKVAEAITIGKKTLPLYIKVEGVDDPNTREFARWFVRFLNHWHHDAEASEVAQQAGLR
jgi:serine/threonine protein kinase